MNLATTRTFNPLYSIPSHSDWYYYTGQTIPDNWYNTDLDVNMGWSETNVDNLPSSILTNHIQLYRKSFTISDVISNIGGFVISIKYKYGCIIYMNGNEVFRKGLSDTLISESSTSSNTYDEVIYRQISLPIESDRETNDDKVVFFVKGGLNVIAIGLVTAGNQGQEQISNPFDCALRLMSDEKESRIFDYDALSEGISGSSANNILNQYYVYSMSSETCGVNSFTINFNNDRHEWINSVTLTLAHLQKTDQPRQFSFEARNENENGGEWTRLLDMSNIEWLESEKSKTFYFYNNKAYNQYQEHWI